MSEKERIFPEYRKVGIPRHTHPVPDHSHTGSGESDAYFRHVQATPATTWTINHDLDKKPSVTVVDSAGRWVIGEIKYISDNQVTVTFGAAFSGEAYCN